MNEPHGVERLLAIEHIRRLVLQYSVAIEGRDVDAMASLFSPRAQFGPSGNGEAGARNLMRESMANSIFAVILVANHLIEFDGGDRAHGEVWATCYAQHDRGRFMRQLIRYEDTYECIEGRWLFLRRRHRLWFGDESQSSPLDQAPARWPKSQVGVGDIPLADPHFLAWYESRHGAQQS